MSDKKTAVDVLLEINKKIEYLIKVNSNQDNNIKLLLSKQNQLEENVNKLKNEIEEKFDKLNLQSLNSPLNEMPSNGVRDFIEDDFPEVNPQVLVQSTKDSKFPKKKESILPKNESASAEKVIVTQFIKDGSNQAVHHADIQIFSMKNGDEQKVNQSAIKTSHLGRWEAILSPGIYTVKVSKGKQVGTQSIEVPKNESQTRLNSFKL